MKISGVAFLFAFNARLRYFDSQRGGPSTGLPTKVEQGDLLHALFAQPGDAPKVVMAASTIEECFHFVITARKLAEDFAGRTDVQVRPASEMPADAEITNISALGAPGAQVAPGDHPFESGKGGRGLGQGLLRILPPA